MEEVTPDILLEAYAAGIFPMAPDRASDELDWYRPESRGVLPLDRFHLPRRLARRVLSGTFRVTSDQAFGAVMQGCAAGVPGRETTWISGRIEALYHQLFLRGNAHSVEIREGETLVGGLYGVSLGGAFFGESMFSRRPDASKVALVHLVAAMRLQGFVLLDTQYGTTHLAQFGGEEIPARRYAGLLRHAIDVKVTWNPAAIALDAVADEVRRLAAEG